MIETAKDAMEMLQFSIDEQRGDLQRLSALQDSFDNRINPDIWPTQSEIPTAQHFTAVEEAIGPALDMCFPESNGLQLIPAGDAGDDEAWRNSEWALWTMITHVMRLKQHAVRSVKDCFKCSVGYGIVEPFKITPQVGMDVVASGKRTRVMADGDSQISIRYRYISPGRVVPFPKGTDFNGPEATPASFFFDPYPLWEIEEMFANGPVDGDADEMQSTLAEIKDASVKFNRSGVDDFLRFAERLGGRRIRFQSSRLPAFAPQSVPVIKVFEQPGTETWIVPDSGKGGKILLRRESDPFVKVRCGLVKWSAWPDGDRWFPMSQPDADQKRGFAYDLWLNFFFDMMTRTKDARLVLNKSALPPGQRRLDPYDDIYVEGNAQQAAAYLQNPQIDPAIPMVGDILDRIGQNIRGTKDFMQKNYTRGGTGAFQDLLNTMQSRQRLSAMILETGALSQVYEHVLAYMQRLVPEGGMELARPIYEAGEGKRIMERKTITIEDLRHGYSVRLDTSERRMLGGMSDDKRFQYWQALVDRDDVVKEEVNRIFPLPDSNIQRVFKKRSQLDQIQADNRDLRTIQQLGGVEPPAAGPGADMMGGVV
jgi:hypothetical protein